MAKRTGISASLRWSVYARDCFCCRYCGKQAGQEGVELVIDHVVSIADGGDNAFDNLLTACSRCNGGKGARSLAAVPSIEATIERLGEQSEQKRRLAEAMRAASESDDEMIQAVQDMYAAAYGGKPREWLLNDELYGLVKLAEEFGPEVLMDWLRSAAASVVKTENVLRYCRGCARRAREAAGA